MGIRVILQGDKGESFIYLDGSISNLVQHLPTH